MTAEMEARGINVNKDTLATKVRNPRRIADLEAAQDAKAKAMIGGDNSDDSDEELEDNEQMRKEEGEERGRKGRKQEKPAKGLLGKRRAKDDADMDSDNDDEKLEDVIDRNIRGSLGKDRRSMTP